MPITVPRTKWVFNMFFSYKKWVYDIYGIGLRRWKTMYNLYPCAERSSAIPNALSKVLPPVKWLVLYRMFVLPDITSFQLFFAEIAA